MSDLLQDLRFAVRSLAKQPGFVVVVVVTLALAAGANTAIFTILNGMLLRPMPFPNAERLKSISMRHQRFGLDQPDMGILDLQSVREQCLSCLWTAGFEESNGILRPQGNQESLRIREAGVSPDQFPALGVKPILGRVFSESDESRGGEAEIILSYRFWQRAMGGDSEIIGREVLLNGQPYSVVGVMEQGFHFPERAEVWRRLTLAAAERRSDRSLDGVVVLPVDNADSESLRATA